METKRPNMTNGPEDKVETCIRDANFANNATDKTSI